MSEQPNDEPRHSGTDRVSLGNHSRRPRIILRATLGAFLAAGLAWPFTLLLFLTPLAGLGMQVFNVYSSLAEAVLSFAAAAMLGMVVTSPVTLLYAATLGLLARSGRDSLGLAIALGAFVGLAIGLTVVTFLRSGSADAGIPTWLARNSPYAVPFMIAGAVLGALQWRIAIYPLRRWRKLQYSVGV